MPNKPLILSIHEQPNDPIAIPRDKIKINHTNSPKHLTKCKCGKCLKEKPLLLALLRAQDCTWISFLGANVRKRKNTFKHWMFFHAPQPLLCPLLLESIISIGLKTFLSCSEIISYSFQIDHQKAKIQDLEGSSSREGLDQTLGCFMSTLSLR